MKNRLILIVSQPIKVVLVLVCDVVLLVVVVVIVVVVAWVVVLVVVDFAVANVQSAQDI